MVGELGHGAYLKHFPNIGRILTNALSKEFRQSNLKRDLKTDQTKDNAGWHGFGGIHACREALGQIVDAFSMVCCSSAIRTLYR